MSTDKFNKPKQFYSDICETKPSTSYDIKKAFEEF